MTSELHQQLTSAFRARFGSLDGMCLARAPGRVNLIGEHTDYNGLAVFPMALDREVGIAFRARRDGHVSLTNLEDRFGVAAFDAGPDIKPDVAGAWGNYPRAATQALWRETGSLSGIEGVVGSTVPVAAGLSSSSALVVACAKALLHANGRTVEPRRLMDLLAAGEQYVGLHGGGMDQAISLGGLAGHALRIDFRPIRLTPVAIPSGWQFIVASTGVEAAKAAGAREAYNSRVRECREALAGFAGRFLADGPVADYGELLRRIAPDEALARAGAALSGVSLRRFRHVVSEGQRVDQAQAAMGRDDLPAFGALMRDSHASLRDDYEVSSPELDRLVEVAEGAGAAGARLTGAGFGGCIVALATHQQAGEVMGALEAVSPLVIPAVPSAGASVSPWR
jgi:galactokinase